MDIWAPGVDIEGASPDCFECTARYSGTSQATPLVTGLVAQYLAAWPDADSSEVRRAIQHHAARHVLKVFGHPYDTMTHLYAQVSSSCKTFPEGHTRDDFVTVVAAK